MDRKRIGWRCAIVLLTFALPCGAAGQVFKCSSAESTVYQDTFCDDAQKLNLSATRPDAAARAAARARTRKEERFVREIEQERESLSREARQERESREKERIAYTRRCDGYLRLAEQADADARRQFRRNTTQRDHERRARELRERHFSECFAAR